MRSLRAFLWRLRAAFGARSALEFAEEMEFHLQMQIADNLLAGMSPSEARRVALVKSGGLASAREAYHDRLGFPLLEALARDLRYSLRMLRRNPVFTAAVVITLAVAIGANTALFSLVDAVMIRPLPYPDASRLVVLGNDEAKSQGVLVAYADFQAWKRVPAFAGLATCTRDSPVTLAGSDAPERLDASQTTASLFAVLGVRPLMGRTFSDAEADGDLPVAVISYGLWQRRFAGAPDVVGRSFTLDSRETRIIGVMPRNFRFPTALTQLWRPIAQRARTAGARPFGLFVGRLRPDTALAEAQGEMAAIAEPPASLIPMQQQIAGRPVRVALWSLFGAVSLVLLMACANVSNLLLARGMVRQHELAVRAALGAGRKRLVGQLMVENALLCSLAGVTGIPLAFLALRALVEFAPAGTPRLDEVGLDGRVLGFTLIVSSLCTLFAGLLPAIEITRSDPQHALKAAGRNKANALIMGECALAMVLLCGAGLMLRSLFFVQHVPLGFEPRNTLIFRVAEPGDWDVSRQRSFYSDALRRIRSLPGVLQAGAIGNFSLTFTRATRIVVEGKGECAAPVMRDSVSEGFFPAAGVALQRGRWNVRPREALINQTLAQRCWPHEDAIGKRFGIAGDWVTVAGIVTDMRRNGVENDGVAQAFLSMEERPMPQADFVVRSNVPKAGMAANIRRELASLDPRVPVFRLATLGDRLAAEQVPRRFETGLLSLFAVVALFLAAVGIFGLLHYSVAQRTGEIGIRMATGARPADVLSMVLKQGCRLASIGLVAGMLGSLLLSRLFTSLPLFGVTATDPPAFAAAAALLGVVVLAACAIPAWKAASVDPLAALRHE